MKESVLCGHLGLGDHLCTNALVRHLAKDQRIIVLAKDHNVDSCRFQWRDNPNILVSPVKDDAMAIAACEMLEKRGINVIRLGLHRKTDTFDVSKWDAEFYRQSGVPFDACWSDFRVDRHRDREFQIPNGRYAFVHDDASRMMVIDTAKLPKMQIIRPTPTPAVDGGPPVIFDWLAVLLNANEIHCIDSSFAILADHLQPKAKRLCLHLYARPLCSPSYKLKWEMIK